MMGQRTTPLVEPAELLGRISSDEPRPLPYSVYPKARDVAQHGVQPLPAVSHEQRKDRYTMLTEMNSSSDGIGHALVIGGSMAGLLPHGCFPSASGG